MGKAEIREQYKHAVLDNGYTSNLIDKSLKMLKAGSNTVYIDLCLLNNKKVVRKICYSKGMYTREKRNYIRLADCDHVPALVNFEDDTNTLIIEYSGKSPANMFKWNLEREVYLPLVKTAYYDMYENYGLHHNDLKWKNITIMDNVAYLIDLVRSDYILADQDTEHILQKIGISKEKERLL